MREKNWKKPLHLACIHPLEKLQKPWLGFLYSLQKIPMGWSGIFEDGKTCILNCSTHFFFLFRFVKKSLKTFFSKSLVVGPILFDRKFILKKLFFKSFHFTYKKTEKYKPKKSWIFFSSNEKLNDKKILTFFSLQRKL